MNRGNPHRDRMEYCMIYIMRMTLKRGKIAATLFDIKCDLGRTLNLYSMYDHTTFTMNNV